MKNREENMQSGSSGEPSKSRVDLFSGVHTTSLIVAALFLFVFLGLMIYLCAASPYESLVLNGLFALLSLLGGFFAGSQIKK